MRTALFNISLFFGLVIGLSISAVGQESGLEQMESPDDTTATPPPADTIFNEVVLTEDGVTAIDTAGNDWYYDFERDLFVLGTRAFSDENRTASRPDYEGLDLPIEERATERRRVKPFESRSITIGYDEYVDGDVLASGRITVKGWVKGDVRSLKWVVVTETGVVEGKVMAPRVDVRDGGIAKGGVQETTAPIEITDITKPFSHNMLTTIAILSGILLVVTFLSTSLMPRHLNNVSLACRHYPIRSSMLGLMLLFLLPLVITLVVVTIVGVLLVPFVPIIYAYALLLGIVAAGDRIGAALLRRAGQRVSSSWMRSFIGVLVVCLVWAATAILMGFSSGAIHVIGILVLVAVSTYTGFIMCNGLGAALLTRLGTRPYVSWRDRQQRDGEAPSPAPPPKPTAPPVVTPPSRSDDSSKEDKPKGKSDASGPGIPPVNPPD